MFVKASVTDTMDALVNLAVARRIMPIAELHRYDGSHQDTRLAAIVLRF